jgi:hypothetical protein
LANNFNLGIVGVVDGSNTLQRLYAFGTSWGSSITANGPNGFLLTYTTPPLNGAPVHVFGDRGTLF